MRGAWGDFARLCSREGVGGVSPTTLAQSWGVNATGRGRAVFTVGCQGVPSWLENVAERLLGWGERRPRFHLCLGSLSLCAAPGEASGAPHSPHPHPSLPGCRSGMAGYQEPGPRLRAV